MFTYWHVLTGMYIHVESRSSCLLSYLITLHFLFEGRASNWIQNYQFLPVCSGNLVSPLECCDPRRLPCQPVIFPVFQGPELWSSFLYKCLSTELATCLIFKFLCGCACAQGWYWDVFLYSPFNFSRQSLLLYLELTNSLSFFSCCSYNINTRVKAAWGRNFPLDGKSYCAE